MDYLDDEQLPMEDDELELMRSQEGEEPETEDAESAPETWTGFGLFQDQTDEQVVAQAQQGDAVA
ncbi:MAG: hypothetical protein J6A48_00505, partial [Clostridia bacterium]|nr:hypothetical protein [Clostridia bacterium]